jgi:hypothetical protein
MTQLLLIITALIYIGCKNNSKSSVEISKLSTKESMPIAYVVKQVRHQSLLYLDTILLKNSPKVVHFYPQLDKSTYQMLQTWITYNHKKVEPSEKSILNQLMYENVDSLILSQFDTTIMQSSITDNAVQVHFNGFSFNDDTTQIATVIGVYFGAESERMTGWEEFIIFRRIGNAITIKNKGGIVEY